MDLCTWYDKLVQERAEFEAHWHKLAGVYMPRRKGAFLGESIPGRRVGQDLYDNEGILCTQVLASALNTYLTSQANRWFEIQLHVPALMEYRDVRMWLELVTKRVYAAMASSNLYRALQELYLDLAVFGTGCLFVEASDEDVVAYRSIPIAAVVLTENARGDVSVVMRKMKPTVQQAEELWGDALPDEIREKAVQNPTEKIEVIHVVGPASNPILRQYEEKPKPFVSVYVMKQNKKILSQGGYYEHPYMVPRWTTESGEVYGRSPAMDALSDLLMLQRMNETVLKSAQKVVDPPLFVPDDGVVGPVRLVPGGLTVVRADLMRQKVWPQPMPPVGKVEFGVNLIELKEAKIRRAFHTDLFLALLDVSKEMTATEVQARMEEKMSVLGPILGRLQRELLHPLIVRTYGILVRAGVLPPPPEIIQGTELRIEYLSPLARAQKLYETRAIARTLGDLAAWAQVNAEVLDRFDVDKVADRLTELYGFPETCKRSEREVALIREQRQKEIEAQRLAAMAEGALKVAKDVDKVSAAKALAAGGAP